MKSFPNSPQPQRNSNAPHSSKARAFRGTCVKNKDNLGSDRNRTLSIKHANEDQFGSQHNQDKRTAAANRRSGTPRPNAARAGQDPSFRESTQDIHKPHKPLTRRRK